MSDIDFGPEPPYTIVLSTVYGQMLVNRHDINQTNSLFKYGRSPDHQEIVLLAQVLDVLGDNLVVLDIGANFGCYSLALAQLVGVGGKIHAFEAQRILFNMLAGSVALNSLGNVYCHNMAVGERDGTIEIPQFDYTQPLNFGSVEFGADQKEALSQLRGRDPTLKEFVPMTTIDRFKFAQINLMKIDVEGMENQVLDGAMDSVARCRPVMYIEFLKVDKEALQSRIANLGYTTHEKGVNFLCIPNELASHADWGTIGV